MQSVRPMVRVLLTFQPTVKVEIITNLQQVIEKHNDELQRLQNENPHVHVGGQRLSPYYGRDECGECAKYNTLKTAVVVSEANEWNTFCLDCANVETHINYMEHDGYPLGQCPECKKVNEWDESSGFKCRFCGFFEGMWAFC